MVKMAEPYQHPETGVFYLRRQIPVALRSEFEGKQLWKRTLGTKDTREAARKFTAANFELERLFDAATLAIAERAGRDVLTAERASALIARRSSAICGERFPLLSNIYWSEEAATSILTDVAAVPMFTNSSPDGIAKLDPEHLPGELWLRVVRTRSLAEALFMAEHMILWAMGHFGASNPPVDVFARGPVNNAAVLNALTAAVEKEVGDLRAAVRSPIISMKTRLRPNMRLGQLFIEWNEKKKAPGLQCAHETKTTVDDFIDFAGDLPVALLSGDHLYNFRDAVSSLPKAMPKVDRALPCNDRVRKYRNHDLAPISPGSVKRRIGHLQALLTYAFGQRWIAANSGSAITIEGYEKNTGNRRPLLDDELSRLFACRLFTQPTTWAATRSTVSDATLAWLFLLGLTSGARIEEIGQTELANIKVDGGVWYFDLGPESRVKTRSSRRPGCRRQDKKGKELELRGLRTSPAEPSTSPKHRRV